MRTFTMTMLVAVIALAGQVTSAYGGETPEEAQARRDQLRIAVQEICPVSGKNLVSMGGPVKAEIEGQTVFLCCKGCVGRKLNPQHWPIVQTNLRMAQVALAQQICPVMGKDLMTMGGPVPTEINGQTVFLCCKGCLNKQVKPEYWDQVQANLKTAQKLCPVRNVELGDEAVPVVVKGRVVYVCCDSGYCIKQVQANPDKYLAMVDTLLAKNLTQHARRPDIHQRQ